MINKFFVAIVVLLWMIAMSWLVVVKILPPFGQGLPPSYRGLAENSHSCWKVLWNDQAIGWAASRVMPGSAGTKDIHARLLLSEVRFAKLTSDWWKQVEARHPELGALDLDAKSRVEIYRLGKLSAIEARVKLNPLPVVFTVRGRVEGSELELNVQTGPFSHTIERLIPESARLGVELSPDAKLPGMYVGRRWQLQVINPLPAGEPTQLIDAEVVREEIIRIDGDLETTRRLELRRTDLVGIDDDEAQQAVLWIAEDGTVLRQETRVLGSKLRFDRILGPQASAKVNELIAPLLHGRLGATMEGVEAGPGRRARRRRHSE
jgi:hypothetical protein